MDRQTCTDCKKEAPQTDSQYTLIGNKFGWRVQRRKTGRGWAVDWRCPECWRVFKQLHPEHVSTQMPATPDPPASRPYLAAEEPSSRLPGTPRPRRG